MQTRTVDSYYVCWRFIILDVDGCVSSSYSYATWTCTRFLGFLLPLPLSLSSSSDELSSAVSPPSPPSWKSCTDFNTQAETHMQVNSKTISPPLLSPNLSKQNYDRKLKLKPIHNKKRKRSLSLTIMLQNSRCCHYTLLITLQLWAFKISSACLMLVALIWP